MCLTCHFTWLLFPLTQQLSVFLHPAFFGLLILILNVEVACLFFTRHEEYVENEHIMFVSAKRDLCLMHWILNWTFFGWKIKQTSWSKMAHATFSFFLSRHVITSYSTWIFDLGESVFCFSYSSCSVAPGMYSSALSCTANRISSWTWFIFPHTGVSLLPCCFVKVHDVTFIHFIPASTACSITLWLKTSLLAKFLSPKYETLRWVWQQPCASEHLWYILTVLNTRNIE